MYLILFLKRVEHADISDGSPPLPHPVGNVGAHFTHEDAEAQI